MLIKIDKPLAREIKEKEGDKSYSIRNERPGHHYKPYRHWINNTEIQWTTLCPKLDNLDEIVKFFEIHEVSKFIFKKIACTILYLFWKLT